MRKLLCIVLLAFSGQVMGQKQLSLENLDDFKPQAGNWQIVGNVTVNRQIDVHEKPAPVVETSTKKKKKKKKPQEPVVEPPKAITFTSGTGILLNINDEEKKDALLTNWEHGDIELELEVMMPKGSNSGIYLQGRYELQLKDSWGVKNPSYSDIGGIHANHAKDFAKKLVGVPPAINAAKAPGLWQKIKVHFQAPKFDESGAKIKNAKIIYADLNGVRIHTNVDIARPTGSPISEEEVAMGPLKIQGNHGPVAIRNIKYTLLRESKVEIKDLTYQVYKGEFNGLEDIANAKPYKEGKAKEIDISVTGEEDNYAVIYSGSLVVPEKDHYNFIYGYTGGIKVESNGETFLESLSASGQGELERSITLPAGTYPFTIYNYKAAAWRAPKLGTFVKASMSNRKSFHQYDSYPDKPSSTSPIYVDVEGRPKMHRGFVTFGNDGPKLSHTIAVGTPGGVHYFYDLGTANLIGAWRGNFVDATPMWNRRGNGSFIARGAVQWTFLNQPIAQLASKDSPFPGKTDLDDFRSKGYQIDESSGLPIFKHLYKGVEVANQIQTDQSNTYITNEVSFSQSNLVNWYLKLAEGEVRQMPDGAYAIGGQQYYINVLTGQSPYIREVEGVMELVLPVDGSSIKYEIIW
ncbi:MAG: DUF1080 domain-containing protein [Cyclobacteriaceae bacterium]